MIDIHCNIDRHHALGWVRSEDQAEQLRFAAMAAAGMDDDVRREIQSKVDAMLDRLARNNAARRNACCA